MKYQKDSIVEIATNSGHLPARILNVDSEHYHLLLPDGRRVLAPVQPSDSGHVVHGHVLVADPENVMDIIIRIIGVWAEIKTIWLMIRALFSAKAKKQLQQYNALK